MQKFLFIFSALSACSAVKHQHATRLYAASVFGLTPRKVAASARVNMVRSSFMPVLQRQIT